MPNPKQVMSAMQAISKAAESAGQKAPVTANKSLTTAQDFKTSLGDSIRQRVAREQEMMDSFNYKYDKGHRVFTEDSAQRNFPPMTVLSRTLEGNRMMREDPNDILSKKIIDELTGKPKRTPYEAGYRVRLEHSPDNWSEFAIPESAIKGAVDKAKGGLARMAEGGSSNYHPDVQDALKAGRITPNQAKWMNNYQNTAGNPEIGTAGIRDGVSEKMMNYMKAVRAGEHTRPNWMNPIPETVKLPKWFDGKVDLDREGLRQLDKIPDLTKKAFKSSEYSNTFPVGVNDVNYYNELVKASQEAPDYQPYIDEINKIKERNPNIGKAKGGAIRMQVGGLSALANLGKAGTLANKGSKGLDAARRAELLMHSGDNALPLVLPRARMSSDFIDQQADRVARQMLGEHVTNGKDTTNLAGRSVKESQRVKGLNYKTTPTGTVAQETPYTPRKGDVKVAFPGDQTVSNKVLNEVEGFPIDSVQEGGAYYGLGQKHLSDPEFWKSTETPAKAVQGKVDRVAELYQPERVIGSHLAMGPMSNNFAMHFADANLRAIDWSKAKPNNVNVFDSIIAYGYKDPKTGERVKFPNWPGLADREGALAAMKEDSNLRKWFNNRMKTPTLTEPLGLPNGLDIQYAVTEPRIRDMEINMTGLMTGKLKPDAKVEAAGNPHNTYSHRILGEAEGPQEVLTPFVIDFPDAAQHIATTKRPSDFTGTIQKVFPHQIVDDQYLNEYNQYRERIKKLTGQKDGGSIEAKPFHDFDQIMKRKDGGTVNTFEQRLKSAINQHMAGGGTVERRYAEAGSVPAPTPQELEKMADAQGAAFGVFPQMASKRFQQPSPTMDRASELLKAQVTKEWEQAGEPGGAKGLALRIGAVLAGGVPDFVNFGQSMIPALNEEKPSFTTVLDSGKKPPAPYRDTREMQTSLKYPMSGTSTDIKNSMREKEMINDDEYPIAELLGSFAAPYALAKAPKAIKGGLNMVKPVVKEAGDMASRAVVPMRRQFEPSTFTIESTADDLGQNTTYGFRQGLNDVLLGNPNLGTGKNKSREAVGTFMNPNKIINPKGLTEINPMMAIDVRGAGTIGNVPSANKALRKQVGQLGEDLNQTSMAGHRFIPLMTNNIKDASSMLIKTPQGLNKDEIKQLAVLLGDDMVLAHNPRLGGVVVMPFGRVEKGQIPEEFLKAQSAAGEVLGKRGKIKFGVSDFDKDRLFMEKTKGDYVQAGANQMSKEQQAQRERLQGLEKFLFPQSRSGIPGQVKAAPVGGLQPWSVGADYPTSVIGIGNGSRVQYQPRNFSTGKEGSRYDTYMDAERERAQMLDEFHRTLVPKYR